MRTQRVNDTEAGRFAEIHIYHLPAEKNVRVNTFIGQTQVIRCVYQVISDVSLMYLDFVASAELTA